MDIVGREAQHDSRAGPLHHTAEELEGLGEGAGEHGGCFVFLSLLLWTIN